MRDNFSIFLPADMASIQKSIDGDEKGNYVRGWASTPDLDKQGDIIDPTGIDITDFLERGYINYEHNGEKRIGVPTRNCYVDPHRGLYVEAKLLMDRPEAKKMWDMAVSIAKSGSNEPLGYSIEGEVIARDSDNPAIIRGVKITNIALTSKPANTKATWETLVKSMTVGTEINPLEMEGGEALRIQALSDSIFNLTFKLKGLTLSDVSSIAKSLDETDRYNEEVAVLLLQLGYGMSYGDACKKINLLNNKDGVD